MKISFILPPPTLGIMGGYKVVYDYANRLVEMGNNVSILYYTNKGKNRRHIPAKIYFLLQSLVVIKEPSWYKLDEKIKKKAVFDINNDNIEDADAIFATAASTAQLVAKLNNKKGKKYYLIQDFETWVMPESQLFETYKLDNMTNITVSKYLKEIVEDNSDKEAVYIPNGIDFCDVKSITLPCNKTKNTIAFLFHDAEHKGTKYTIEALEIVKKQRPDIIVKCFGSCKDVSCLPNWISYTYNASRIEVKEIMDNSSIFVCSTINEGFGLTGAESMACGCALVSSDYPAVHEYAIDRYNCLLSKTKDSKELANNVISILDDDKLRLFIANNALKSIKKFSWDVSARKLSELLKDNN